MKNMPHNRGIPISKNILDFALNDCVLECKLFTSLFCFCCDNSHATSIRKIMNGMMRQNINQMSKNLRYAVGGIFAEML